MIRFCRNILSFRVNISIGLIFSLISTNIFAGTIIQVVDKDLDLPTQLAAHQSVVESETGEALVEYGPQLVVGQGASVNNYTIVKILNKFQICELQFLAYPSTVRGGVNVSAGSLFDTDFAIATCPIADTTTNLVKVFDRHGVLLYEFEPDTILTPPFVIAVGEFNSNNSYNEIAIASRDQGQLNRDILIYSGDGQLLNTVTAPNPYSDFDDTLVMSTKRISGSDQLILYYQVAKKSVVLEPSIDRSTVCDMSELPDGSGVYQSAFDQDGFVAGGPETLLSTLYNIDKNGAVNAVDAGFRENQFWAHIYSAVWSDSQYIKNGRYYHIRPDYYSDNYANPDFSSDVYTDWVGSRLNSYLDSTTGSYNTSIPTMWEPTFTHRHAASQTAAWYNQIDFLTGQHKYMMLDRDNFPITYTEGTGTFNCLTYAFDLPAIDHLYIWPQRAFLRRMAYILRGPDGNPNKMIGVEPNHEFEIPPGGNGSIGDYNSKMINGFYDHLIMLYSDLNNINTVFGTSFTSATSFDAPRNYNRGSWDAYSTSNNFYNAWVEYNRKVIFRRLGQGFTESLIAGLPPELIKTHQIPQGYAVGQPIVDRRITPVDWIFSAGTGYGGTRYGIWYHKVSNWLQAAYTSGQSMISVGEYDPVKSSYTEENLEIASDQLSYMFNNGVNFIHHMTFSDLNIRKESVLSLQDDGPRPGTAGGIGQIRPVVQLTENGPKKYNIACIGTGENRTGLLKSLDAEGNWEGSVYVVPFHADTQIIAVGEEDQSFSLTNTQYDSGAISGLMAGDQVEIRFKAKTDDSNGMVTLVTLHEGFEMAGHRKVLQIPNDWTYYRYILRIQSVMGDIRFLMNSGQRDTLTAYSQNIQFQDFSVIIHKTKVARKRYDIESGVAHSGGVTFDVLSPSHICGLEPISGDFNYDCLIDIYDLSIFVSQWLGCTYPTAGCSNILK